ncbi:glyoxalase [Flavisolibacter ginsenosidimutans]|uniref:Glyoxalase n=1 Tax=Flavisolibacter ginsenosidimutans TaxID=661481 RepID=A0A5B8UPF8_9BACT|nr:glyoxalase [Flavisolibacter ginsenosidimutans]
MNVARIKETCIYVTNLQTAKTFYNTMLRLPLISFVEERHVFFRAGESVLLCFVAAKTLQEKELPPHGASGPVHFAFEVESNEYDKTLWEVKEAGIEILHEHNWDGHHRSFYFHDPDKNLLEVIEEGLWEADVE